MTESNLRHLHDDLKLFIECNCSGCNTCSSTQEICHLVVELKLKINRKLKEIDEYGK